MKIVWLSDIHVNFLKRPQVEAFFVSVAEVKPEVILIGGDIAESRDFAPRLLKLAQICRCPIYFVLGNHDFYRSSMAVVRRRASTLHEEQANLQWLSQCDVIELTRSTGLIGHEGWADGRLGSYASSTIRMNDDVLIEDLADFDKATRLGILHRLGDEAAAHFARVLPLALERYEHTLLLTHVPPFREACRYEGKISDDQWLPHMGCKAVGDVLLELMRKYADRRLTVLCGHTHGASEVDLLPNLHVITAAAAYGLPVIARTIVID